MLDTDDRMMEVRVFSVMSDPTVLEKGTIRV